MKATRSRAFDALESIPVADGLVWHPIRRRFGISAFGINVLTRPSGSANA